MELIQRHFEGHDLVALEYQGRPALIAKQVGDVLGYSESGAALINMIGREWAAQFLVGKHYVIVDGEALRGLKRLVVSDAISARTPRLMLLFEEGLNLVCINTGKPIGDELRALFAETIMPALTRTGRYLSDSSAAELVPGPGDERSAENWRVLRERRLAVKQRADMRLALARESRLQAKDERRDALAAAKLLLEAVQGLGERSLLPEALIGSYMARAANLVMGLPVQEPVSPTPRTPTPEAPGAPDIPEDGEWRSPSQLARKWFAPEDFIRGRRLIGVGASALELRGDVKHSRFQIDWATNGTEQKCYQYDYDAAVLIWRWMKPQPVGDCPGERPRLLTEVAAQPSLPLLPRTKE